MLTHLFLWRRAQHLTQRQAAEKLGLPFLSYRLLESGRYEPTSREWDSLREHFGAGADDILSVFDSGSPNG